MNRQILRLLPIAAYCSETAAHVGGLRADMNEHRPRSAPHSVDFSGARWTHPEPLLSGRFGVRVPGGGRRSVAGSARLRSVSPGKSAAALVVAFRTCPGGSPGTPPRHLARRHFAAELRPLACLLLVSRRRVQVAWRSRSAFSYSKVCPRSHPSLTTVSSQQDHGGCGRTPEFEGNCCGEVGTTPGPRGTNCGF